jgi:hypothetical protein
LEILGSLDATASLPVLLRETSCFCNYLDSIGSLKSNSANRLCAISSSKIFTLKIVHREINVSKSKFAQVDTFAENYWWNVSTSRASCPQQGFI